MQGRLAAARRVQRPRAGVEAREDAAGGAVAAAREAPGLSAAGEDGGVAQPADGLQLAVEDPHPGVERVHRVAAAAGGGDGHADRRRLLEGAEGAAREAGVARLPERAGAAHERLHGGRLGHPADPRRRAAAVGEVVLPGEEAAAWGREGHEPVEVAAQGRAPARGAGVAPRPQAGVGQAVDATPARQRVQLEAAAHVVLQHRGAGHPPLARGGHRVARPRDRVAPQLLERRGEASRPEPARGRQLLDARHDRRELGLPGALEPAHGGARGLVVAAHAIVLGARQAALQQRPAQRRGDGGRGAQAPELGAPPGLARGRAGATLARRGARGGPWPQLMGREGRIGLHRLRRGRLAAAARRHAGAQRRDRQHGGGAACDARADALLGHVPRIPRGGDGRAASGRRSRAPPGAPPPATPGSRRRGRWRARSRSPAARRRPGSTCSPRRTSR